MIQLCCCFQWACNHSVAEGGRGGGGGDFALYGQNIRRFNVLRSCNAYWVEVRAGRLILTRVSLSIVSLNEMPLPSNFQISLLIGIPLDLIKL